MNEHVKEQIGNLNVPVKYKRFHNKQNKACIQPATLQQYKCTQLELQNNQ